MKNKICKVFALSLALLMLLSLLSLTVAAEGETPVESQTTVETDAETADLTETATVTDTETEDAAEAVTNTGTEEPTEAVTDGEAEDGININFQPEQFVINLKYMAAGMVGIFLVIGVIILTIVLLGKLTAPKNKDEE